MHDALCTLKETASHENIIRKSRFLAQAASVADEAEAMAFLRSVSNSSANHNCWAWRLGQNVRFNDDSEPGGSAGKPMLMAIEGQQLDRIMVVVTRWFGGIKLGVGGLARAYGGTTAECLRLAPQVEIVEMTAVEFRLGYAEMELFRARTRDWPTETLHEDFGASGVHAQIKVAQNRAQELETLLADLSRGQCQLDYLQN
ncbi:MAG TPA: YigZ family protein [Gammaproteobacteria bacterium]|nr:YigZ family protein [Gammaproteobacteria bacterium]